MRRLSIFLTLVFVASSAANPVAQQRATALVKRLADRDYRQREQAAAELLGLGRHAYAALAAGAQDADPEIRSRCRRLLPMAFDHDLRARIEAFVADVDGKGTHQLPGLERWNKMLGESRPARDLFVAVLRADGRLMDAIENQPSAFGLERLVARCVELQARLHPRDTSSPKQADVAQLMFLGTQPDLAVTPSACAQVNQFLYRPEVRGWFTEGEHASLMRRLIVRWLERTIDEPNTGYMISNLMSSLQLPELSDLALKVVIGKKAPAHVRANLLITLGRQGRKEMVEPLQPVIADTTQVGQFAAGANRQTTLLGDVALAMSIHLSGQRPADFGFTGVTNSTTAIFSYYRLGFASDAERNAARAKWEEWRAKWKKNG